MIAFSAFMVQALTGHDWLTPEAQGAVIAILNIVLRFDTNSPIH
mgnify:CR=1 FL=1